MQDENQTHTSVSEERRSHEGLTTPLLSSKGSILGDRYYNDIWNVSAFDFPIVASGHDTEEVQHNFVVAVRGYFEAVILHRGIDHAIQLLVESNRRVKGDHGANCVVELRIYSDKSVVVQSLTNL